MNYIGWNECFFVLFLNVFWGNLKFFGWLGFFDIDGRFGVGGNLGFCGVVFMFEFEELEVFVVCLLDFWDVFFKIVCFLWFLVFDGLWLGFIYLRSVFCLLVFWLFFFEVIFW